MKKVLRVYVAFMLFLLNTNKFSFFVTFLWDCLKVFFWLMLLFKIHFWTKFIHYLCYYFISLWIVDFFLSFWLERQDSLIRIFIWFETFNFMVVSLNVCRTEILWHVYGLKLILGNFFGGDEMGIKVWNIFNNHQTSSINKLEGKLQF